MNQLSTNDFITTTTGKPKDDEYIGEDGLLYCKNCNTLRVTKNVIEGFGRHMPITCKCQKERLERQEQQAREMRRIDELSRLRKASLLGERYREATFSNTEMIQNESFQKAYKRCKKYCEISSEALQNGYGIYIYGSSGVGKSHLTACICNELIEQRKNCVFTNFLEISKLIRASFGKNETDDTISKICNVDFLVIDDFGTELVKRNGEDNWLQEQIFDIINKRYNNKKPTIFSSNYSLNELVEQRGLMAKTVDRVGEMATAIIKVEGTSYRRNKRPKVAPF